MRYRLGRQELFDHWNEQLNFIQSSVRNFDEGNENEARRIATSLRIMFHETSRSHSLFKQINLNHNFFLWSSGELYTPSNLLSSWILLQLNRSKDGLFYKPLGTNSKRTFFLSYEDWWNEVIFDDKKNVFTRKDIVTFVANQDGGAHVDKALDGKYAELVKHNSLGWTDGEGNPIVNNPAYNAIRQIALEVIISQNKFNNGYLNRRKKKEKTFEMRLFDKVRRFKWSTTEITYSDETLDIVTQYSKERRTLYIQEFNDGTKVELVLR